MRIWHVDTAGSSSMVNGVVNTMWLVASTQAQLGHSVTLYLHEDPTPRDLAASHDSGLTLARSHREAAGLLARSPLSRTEHPDVVHFHSVFIPSHAAMSLSLRRRHIPYVVTPHGGLSTHILERHSAPKRLYAATVERTRMGGAAALTAVHPGEVAEIRRFVGSGGPAITVVGNPIDTKLFASARWEPSPPPTRLVFLGRYDVHHKGLDRLFALARRLPDVQVRLHGLAPDASDRDYQHLVANAPRNVSINGPVYGASKIDVLKSASMYVQLSRWEAQSISLAEALYLGVPVAVSDHTNMAADVGSNDLGVVLSDEPSRAAEELRSALCDEEHLRTRSDNAAAFARSAFDPRAVAEGYIHVYESVAAGSGAGSSAV